jgi:hypothetical protein
LYNLMFHFKEKIQAVHHGVPLPPTPFLQRSVASPPFHSAPKEKVPFPLCSKSTLSLYSVSFSTHRDLESIVISCNSSYNHQWPFSPISSLLEDFGKNKLHSIKSFPNHPVAVWLLILLLHWNFLKQGGYQVRWTLSNS